MKSNAILCLLITASMSFCSPLCNFNKTKWNDKADHETYLFRLTMLECVLKMKFLNKSQKEIINLIGKPDEEYTKKPNEICYFIDREYTKGLMYEPLQAKILVFIFDNDKLCLSHKVEYRW